MTLLETNRKLLSERLIDVTLERGAIEATASHHFEQRFGSLLHTVPIEESELSKIMEFRFLQAGVALVQLAIFVQKWSLNRN